MITVLVKTLSIRCMMTISVATLALFIPATSLAMTLAERAMLDLTAYVVTDPAASYFDVAARKDFLKKTTDPDLLNEIEKARFGVSCRSAFALPIIHGKFLVPMYYKNPEGWKEISRVFLAFEDTVSALAAAQTVSDDTYHGECLVKLLYRWASAQAFESFLFEKQELQTWFQVESSLFSAALAYSVVREQVPGMAAEKEAVEDWLRSAARLHLSIKGGENGSCCNNHFYRRAVYAAIIGVLTADHDLFRFGISAIYSAVSDANMAGALPLEMLRGQSAARYQNFATMYLVFIAQIAKRQGYDMFAVSINGRSLDNVVSLTLNVIENPQSIAAHASSPLQNDRFLNDNQFLSWLELVQHRYHDGIVSASLGQRRPLYNRSLGGFMTLYFAEPTDTPLFDNSGH